MLPIQQSKSLLKIASFRSIHTGRPTLISEKALQKFKLKQAKMQCGNEHPVYIKHGIRDKILYHITKGTVVFATIGSLHAVYKSLKD